MKVVLSLQSLLKRSDVVILLIIFSYHGLVAENVEPRVLTNGKATTVPVKGGDRSQPSQLLKDNLSCPEDGNGRGRADCEKDRMGLESIMMLHRMLDDDHNGNVDQSESDEFLRDELQYTDGFERQALFHNNDKLISVDDLWKAWKNSVVYNWTVDDMVDWLIQDVDLPQYQHVFHTNSIDGSFLPRLVNSTGPLLSALGIRNPVHKQKVSLKAMDTVLFGAPKRVHSYIKDLLLVTSLMIAIGGCWFACLHHRYSQTQVKKMMKDLESLQKAEEALKILSNELTEAEKNQKSVPPEKQEEMRMLRQSSIRLKPPRRQSHTGDISPSLSREGSIVRRQEGERRLKVAEEEVASLREALSEAESKLENQQQQEFQWCVPGELQAWLQLTYELEQLHYTAKHQAAERQLMAARDGCDKIKKRNKAFLGSLRMAHSNSLDEIDQSILNARGALEEVKQDLEERRHRWHTVELLCGFPVITNPGLSALKLTLGRDPGGNGGSTRGGVASSLGPLSIDEGDEDIPPADDTSDFEDNIFNKISDRQKKQIFAWASRSRLKKRKVVANGYPSLPAPLSSKNFLKQIGGSTNSLSHAGNPLPGSSTHGTALLRRESRENELHVSTHPSGTGPVSFHLGEGANNHHERSHSNVSSTGMRGGHQPTTTNGHSTHPHQQHQHAMGHHSSSSSHSHSHSKLNSPGYVHANSYPPHLAHNASVAGSNNGLASPGSTGTLLSHKSSTPLAGSASNLRSHHTGHLAGNLRQSPDDLPMAQHRPETLMLNASLESDHHHHHTTSLDTDDAASTTDSHNQLRPSLDRSPEFDLNSLEAESLHSASHLEAKNTSLGQKKPSKKKKFPAFFKKTSSSKQKVS